MRGHYKFYHRSITVYTGLSFAILSYDVIICGGTLIIFAENSENCKFKPTNQDLLKVPKIFMTTNKIILDFKTSGTSLIYIPVSPPSLLTTEPISQTTTVNHWAAATWQKQSVKCLTACPTQDNKFILVKNT